MGLHSTEKSTAMGSQKFEKPTEDQWANLLFKVKKQKLSRGRMQQFIDRLTLENLKKPLEPEPEIIINERFEQTINSINEYFPESADNIIELLSPYSNLEKEDIDFKTSGMEFSDKYYPKIDELREALFWVKTRDYVKIWTLNKDWIPRHPIKDVNNPSTMDTVIYNMFKEERNAREALQSQTIDHAQSIAMDWSSPFSKLFKQLKARQYHLVSMEDTHTLYMQVIHAMQTAIIIAAVQPDIKLAKAIMKFVDWQLGGNPIVGYDQQTKIPEILVAPYFIAK